MFRIIILIIVGTGFLSGCDTRPLNELTYAEQQEMLVQFTATCAASGITESNPEYRTCVQTEINAENAKRGRKSQGMSQLGAGLSATGQSYSSAAQNNRPVTCNTSPAIGWGSSRTTCY